MDYKMIFRNRKLRLRILSFFDFMPDKLMVQAQYFIKTGRRLNLKKPKRFTEKIQWYKLFYRDAIMQQCVDKYEVREYLKQHGFSNILNEVYGVFSSPDEIDFDRLPESFVLKDTLGGGGNAVLIIKDKNGVDLDILKEKMWEWIRTPIGGKHPGREWVYEGKRHRILVEKCIGNLQNSDDMTEYKFFCFRGKCEFLYVIVDRTLGEKVQLGIYDASFQKLPVTRKDELPLQKQVVIPQNYAEMLQIAETLSSSFLEARIDLYNCNGNIIFGEITFFDGSGYMSFVPDEFDEKLGEKFIIA